MKFLPYSYAVNSKETNDFFASTYRSTDVFHKLNTCIFSYKTYFVRLGHIIISIMCKYLLDPFVIYSLYILMWFKSLRPFSCLLRPRLRPFSCLLRPFSCLLRPRLRPFSCLLRPISCLLRPFSCLLRPRLRHFHVYLDPFHVYLDPFRVYKLVSILIGLNIA